ncbi:hypothetical protein L0B53_14815 [Vibrio sp. SS-MA-C1-2]|uniref:hypothetical protein n=1 Tax=Vibrio sp. SS-MA-C1-2 TaxID=2908646 RepID=UPI001F22D199|nr:hypothetical protein [Vibrio sp. SS-MA-C1-2]UJF18280.1 hypothetical protein L0B53_14815 [Vibrio sp. SS-MA-C1-2]
MMELTGKQQSLLTQIFELDKGDGVSCLELSNASNTQQNVIQQLVKTLLTKHCIVNVNQYGIGRYSVV